MKKTLLWFILGGLVYYAIEGHWRLATNGGWAQIFMMYVGGLCFILVGGINQIPFFYGLSMRLQSFIGTLIVLAIEFISGCILNLWLHMGIWDYSHLPFNIMGQVCLPFGIIWFLLMPFAIWFEDKLNLWYAHYKYKSDIPEYENVYDYSLFDAYKELICPGGINHD